MLFLLDLVRNKFSSGESPSGAQIKSKKDSHRVDMNLQKVYKMMSRNLFMTVALFFLIFVNFMSFYDLRFSDLFLFPFSA